MRLYIAEKPSLATEIAKNLPGPMRKFAGFIETGGGIVTWCYGHILRTFEPGEYDPKYKKWNLADLPIVPLVWKLKVADKCGDQFKVIQGLLKTASEVVHAGDPDREGQLLVDEVLEHLHYKKKVLRVLINAQDEKSIKTALADLRDNRDFVSLRDSALARSRADWLVGMNLTRAYTIMGRRAGHSTVFNVGRVKTPTLGLVVRREREIKNFVSVDYAVIRGEFKPTVGSPVAFWANWKAKDDQAGFDSVGRLVDKAVLKKLLALLRSSQKAQITLCETNLKKESQPLPFSLSSLQIAAGKRFGYSPQVVLDTAQKLYENKLTTYPRSDCDYLPESQLVDVQRILQNLGRFNPMISAWVSGADTKLKSRAWNDKEITAHHAIIPTTVCAKESNLSETEQDIYSLIAQAYIAQFYPLHEFNQTNVSIDLVGEEFTARGRVVVKEGFKVLYRSAENEKTEDEEKQDDDSALLPPMQKGDALNVLQVASSWKKTQPPKRFTQATLVQAMKDIHRYVKDPDKKKRLKSTKGIGTVATQATIIEELIRANFMKVVKKFLEPTEAAYVLIDVLPETITLPDETAEWEDGLEGILKKEKGVTLDTFVNGLASRLPELMNSNKISSFESKNPCPECGKGSLIRRPGKKVKGEFWWGCTMYPTCKATRPDDKGKPGEKQGSKLAAATSDYPCPDCKKGFLIKRKGTNGKGDWWGCNRYPECKTTRADIKGKPDKR